MFEPLRRFQQQLGVFWPGFVFLEGLTYLIIIVALGLVVVFFPPAHESVARPMDTGYIPRPEWYFLFLFQMLKFFPGELEVIGAIFVPAVAIGLLLLLPFIDRNPSMHVKRRPLAVTAGAAIVLGIGFLTVQGLIAAPPMMTERAAYIDLGEKLYKEQDCSACHAINGVGGTIGPDLAGIGERRILSWVHVYIEDPPTIRPDSTMPGYVSSLTHEEIESIALYLMTIEEDTSERSPAQAPLPPSAQPTSIPHTLEGRSSCLTCHETGIGGARIIPHDHGGRGNDVCLSCHKTE